MFADMIWCRYHHRVRVLTETGLTGRFANWMIGIAGDNHFTISTAFAFISAFLVNCLNDLASTVFWAGEWW